MRTAVVCPGVSLRRASERHYQTMPNASTNHLQAHLIYTRSSRSPNPQGPHDSGSAPSCHFSGQVALIGLRCFVAKCANTCFCVTYEGLVVLKRGRGESPHRLIGVCHKNEYISEGLGKVLFQTVSSLVIQRVAMSFANHERVATRKQNKQNLVLLIILVVGVLFMISNLNRTHHVLDVSISEKDNTEIRQRLYAAAHGLSHKEHVPESQARSAFSPR
eukprot:9228888-Pyramimonas_sp.AAC.1